MLEIPDEETSEEEHDIELENANQQAWENRSAAQKEYLEMIESSRTRDKLILRRQRTPSGKVKPNPLLSLHPTLIGIPDPRMERWDELTQECFLNNAVVRLDRNDIPNWHRAQRNTAQNKAQDKPEEHTHTDSDEEEVKFVGAILKSDSKYGGVVDGTTTIERTTNERTKASNNNANKCKCGEHTTNIGVQQLQTAIPNDQVPTGKLVKFATKQAVSTNTDRNRSKGDDWI